MTHPSFQLKLASEVWEFEAIHRLNYRTFVEEIPQHAPNPDGRLVDRFHAENRYVIALQGRHLAGMLALRAARPRSRRATSISRPAAGPSRSASSRSRRVAGARCSSPRCLSAPCATAARPATTSP